MGSRMGSALLQSAFELIHYRWFIFDWGAIFCAGRLYWGVKKVRPNQKRRDDSSFPRNPRVVLPINKTIKKRVK